MDDDARRELRQRDRAAEWDRWVAPQPSHALPLSLPARPPPISLPRRVWVQADPARQPQAPGGRLGSVTWEEHERACVRPAPGWPVRDPEREAAAGGLGYGEMVERLGREPEGWRRV